MFIATEDLISAFRQKSEAWIRSQRQRYRDGGEPLSAGDRGALQAYFQESTLDKVKICQVSAVENPSFYGELKSLDRTVPLLDLRSAAGLTYIDTVLIVPARFSAHNRLSLLFHECVHVVQYQIWGVNGFIQQYVKGWPSWLLWILL